MSDWLLSLIHAGDWWTLGCMVAVVLVAIACVWVFGAVVATLLTRRWDEDDRQREINRAYLLGRRDERTELARELGELPIEEHPEIERLTSRYGRPPFEAKYPVIIETLPDGSKRRLDR